MVPEWCGLCRTALESRSGGRGEVYSRPPRTTADRFVERYPYLWHLAHGDAWPVFQAHGLLSAQRLVDLFEVSEHDRWRLLTERRDESVHLQHPQHATRYYATRSRYGSGRWKARSPAG